MNNIPSWEIKKLFDPVAETFGNPSLESTREKFGVACARYKNNYPYFTDKPASVTNDSINASILAEKKGVTTMHGHSTRYNTLKVLKLITISLLLAAGIIAGIMGNTETSRDVQLAGDVSEIIVYMVLGAVLIAYFYPRTFYPIYSKTDYTFVFIAGILIIVTAILKIKPAVDHYQKTAESDDDTSDS